MSANNGRIDVTRDGTKAKGTPKHPYPCPQCESVATTKVAGLWTCSRCGYAGKGFIPMYRRTYDPSGGGVRSALAHGDGFRRLPKI